MPNITDTILQKGVDFPITVDNPNFLHKMKLLKSERKFVIYPLHPGPLLLICKLLNSIEKIDIDKEPKMSILEFTAKKIELMDDKYVRMISLAIFNKKFSKNKFIRYFQNIKFNSIIDYLDNNSDNLEILKLMTVVTHQMGHNSFFATSVLIGKMKIIETEIKTEKQ